MQVQFTHPHPALLPYIEGYFYMDMKVHSDSIDLHPVGYNALSFILNTQKAFNHDDFDFNFRLSHNGHICEHTSFRALASSVKMIVVPFTATGAYRLFSISQHELINRLLPLEEVVRGSRDLRTRLEDAVPSAQQAITLIERWLLQQIPSRDNNHYTPKIDYACHLIRSHNGNIRIKALCREIGMSQTYLEDHFKEMVGTSAKLYSRITRFMAAYQFLCRHSHTKWTDLVHRYDFFDQSHFIREFKTFFGCTPSRMHTMNHQIAQGITLKPDL